MKALTLGWLKDARNARRTAGGLRPVLDQADRQSRLAAMGLRLVGSTIRPVQHRDESLYCRCYYLNVVVQQLG